MPNVYDIAVTHFYLTRALLADEDFRENFDTFGLGEDGVVGEVMLPIAEVIEGVVEFIMSNEHVTVPSVYAYDFIEGIMAKQVIAMLKSHDGFPPESLVAQVTDAQFQAWVGLKPLPREAA